MKPAPRAIRLERIRRPAVPWFSRRAWARYLAKLDVEQDEIAEVLGLEVAEVEQLLERLEVHSDA